MRLYVPLHFNTVIDVYISVGLTAFLKCIKQSQTNIKIYLGACTACGDAGNTFMMIEIGIRPLNKKSWRSFNVTIKGN